MVIARDIMTRNVVTIQENTPIYKAIELLAEFDITGMPVVDENESLLGIITEQDVMRLFFDESNLICSSQDEQNKTVKDFMTVSPIFFDEDESLLSVCHCLKDCHFRRAPITSKGRLVGVISRQDIIRYVLQQRHCNNNR
jgi:CBS domain-containing protein